MKDNDLIIYSDNNLCELELAGYSIYEIENMFKPFKSILLFVESNKKQVGKARGLASKRGIPKRDALHALIARDNKAIMVTLDNHFKEILDIIIPKRPQDLI